MVDCENSNYSLLVLLSSEIVKHYAVENLNNCYLIKIRHSVCPIKVETLSKLNKSFIDPLFALFSMDLTKLDP